MKEDFDYSKGEKDFKKLVEIFANGRNLCNCRNSYYDEEGSCKWGCSANQIDTKYEIASHCIKLLEIK